MTYTKNRPINWLLSALLASSLILPATETTASAQTAAAPIDLGPTWARPAVEAGLQAGWINGYADGTFRPQAQVTRAEFVKMLSAATGLTPNSATSQFLLNGWNGDVPFTDIKTSWLYDQGWFGPAFRFGYIEPSDYGSRFDPNRPITRQEIAVMVDRALGLVYPARQEPASALPYKDPIPDWGIGYLHEASKAGVIQGYPDGTFGWGRTATRAEAATFVSRALTEMDRGADPNLQVYVTSLREFEPDAKVVKVDLAVPAQVIDDVIYAPARSLMGAAYSYHREYGSPRFSWMPKEQMLTFEYGTDYAFEAGRSDYRYYNEYRNQWMAQPRISHGELMIPVYRSDFGNQSLFRPSDWDAATRTLTVETATPQAPIS